MGPSPGDYLASSSYDTERCYPRLQTITLPGMERLRDEVGKETVEAPSDRKGNEKGTTALPCGGRPTGKTCPPLTEITRGFPGKNRHGSPVNLTPEKTEHLRTHLFHLVTHSRLLTFSEPIRIRGLDSSSEKNYIMCFLLCKAFLFSGLKFTITLIYSLVGSPCLPLRPFLSFIHLEKLLLAFASQQNIMEFCGLSCVVRSS